MKFMLFFLKQIRDRKNTFLLISLIYYISLFSLKKKRKKKPPEAKKRQKKKKKKSQCLVRIDPGPKFGALALYFDPRCKKKKRKRKKKACPPPPIARDLFGRDPCLTGPISQLLGIALCLWSWARFLLATNAYWPCTATP